ncbi:hypothetical protein CSH63_32860 [Micromonospora tulbaghiae]|uniref:TFIIB-type zinc ribbon-containing protein n=1 Tax=Micromonospora tulbaghiae TaxID=479978 RepID=A0A386WYK6_9ACTN|nr:hypothetical protein CSH63_32860 [Micromonospora tulbaghiae]
MASAERGSTGRFRDPRNWLGGLAAGEVLVRCPRCAERASVLPCPEEADGTRHDVWLRRRLSCLGCAYTALWEAPRLANNARAFPEFSGPNDPYFGQPLWLSIECRGRVLWAYNAEHLDLLEAYVSAQLRERGQYMGSQTLVERLPAWVKEGRHRAEVRGAIGQLRATLA